MIKNWTQWLCLEKCYCHFCEILNIKYNTWYKNIKFTSVQPFSVFKLLIQLFCWCRYFIIFSLTHLKQKIFNKNIYCEKYLSEWEIWISYMCKGWKVNHVFYYLKRKRHSKKKFRYFSSIAVHLWTNLTTCLTFSRCLSMHP